MSVALGFDTFPAPTRRRIIDRLVADCDCVTLKRLGGMVEGVEMLRWLLTTDDEPEPIDA